MTSVCEPRLAICARMAACAPCPIASIATTAATPMITPSMVSAERRVFRRKARWAMRYGHEYLGHGLTFSKRTGGGREVDEVVRRSPSVRASLSPIISSCPSLETAILEFTELVVVNP